MDEGMEGGEWGPSCTLGFRRSRNSFGGPEVAITYSNRHFCSFNAFTSVLWLWLHSCSLRRILALESCKHDWEMEVRP